MTDEMIYTPESDLGREHRAFSRLNEQMNALRREKTTYAEQKAEAEQLIASLTPTSPGEAFVAAAAARERISVLSAALLGVDQRMGALSADLHGARQGYESACSAWRSIRSSLLDQRTSPRERERQSTLWRQLTGLEWKQ